VYYFCITFRSNCRLSIESVLEFAESNGIPKPSPTLQKGRQSAADKLAKRPRIEVDLMLKYKEEFEEILDVFFNHISEKFN